MYFETIALYFNYYSAIVLTNKFFLSFARSQKQKGNNMEKLLLLAILLVACLLSASDVLSLSEEESCVSYGPGAGSHVYPMGSKSDGHQLQYTKAVSK